MNYSTNCKFCHKPITVQVDDEYSKLGDPFNLLKMASCNDCSDLRVEKRRLEGKIKRVCMILHLSSKKDKGKLGESIRSTLTEYTKNYANMIARWHHKDGMAWDEECVNLLMDKPDKWNIIIAELWKLYQSWENQSEAL